MKTFQQFNETMVMPLKMQIDGFGSLKFYNFKYEGRRYRVDVDQTMLGSGPKDKVGIVTFAVLLTQFERSGGKTMTTPTGHNSGQFKILATVIAAMDDAFEKEYYTKLIFNAKPKLASLYRALAKKLAGSKYHVEIEEYQPAGGTSSFDFVVTKK